LPFNGHAAAALGSSAALAQLAFPLTLNAVDFGVSVVSGPPAGWIGSPLRTGAQQLPANKVCALRSCNRRAFTVTPTCVASVNAGLIVPSATCPVQRPVKLSTGTTVNGTDTVVEPSVTRIGLEPSDSDPPTVIVPCR